MSKKSIRFYKDHKVRAVWDEDGNHWWFSVLDIVGAINQQDDHYRTIGRSMDVFGMQVENISHKGNYVECVIDQAQFGR